MGKIFALICSAMIILTITSSFATFPAVFADEASAKEQALAFIENVLLVDMSKYNVTFEKYSTIDGTVGDLRYSLDSQGSTIDVTCRVEKNVLTSCHLYPMNGPIISDRHYSDLSEAVRSFLEKYQNYSKLDSTKFASMLAGLDLAKNTTTVVNDTKLTVTKYNFAGEEPTHFNWAYTVNGVDYSLLQLGFFKEGDFETILDNRAVYTFADTSVNISREQAIEISLGNLSSYSYLMPDHSTVSDFNVTKDKIWAELAVSRSNYEFRPYWDIRLPLNQTYPGSVHGISVFIWANTGEIISYGNIAFGGIEYDPLPSPSPVTSAEPPQTATPSPTPSDTPAASPTTTPPWVLPLIESEHIRETALRNAIITVASIVAVISVILLLVYFKKIKK